MKSLLLILVGTFLENVLGTYLCMREGGKLMAKAGEDCGGRIITVSSVHGLGGTHYNAIYSSSKAAVIAFTKSAAFDLADVGIRVRGSSFIVCTPLTACPNTL